MLLEGRRPYVLSCAFFTFLRTFWILSLWCFLLSLNNRDRSFWRLVTLSLPIMIYTAFQSISEPAQSQCAGVSMVPVFPQVRDRWQIHPFHRHRQQNNKFRQTNPNHTILLSPGQLFTCFIRQDICSIFRWSRVPLFIYQLRRAPGLL